MKLQHLKNVATLAVHPDRCVGCGRCLEVCPHNVLEIKERTVHITNKNACMECGACSENCAFNAISVKSGVGCSTAIIKGWLKGTEPNCDCGSGEKSDCC